MNQRNKKNQVKLQVELLEDRCVPAWLTSAPGAFTVQGVSDNGYSGAPGFQFQLQAAISATSNIYNTTPADPNPQWQVVRSTPTPFEQVRTPTPAEWALLANDFPSMGFAPSLRT